MSGGTQVAKAAPSLRGEAAGGGRRPPRGLRACLPLIARRWRKRSIGHICPSYKSTLFDLEIQAYLLDNIRWTKEIKTSWTITRVCARYIAPNNKKMQEITRYRYQTALRMPWRPLDPPQGSTKPYLRCWKNVSGTLRTRARSRAKPRWLTQIC